jgi:hypothetical protein
MRTNRLFRSAAIVMSASLLSAIVVPITSAYAAPTPPPAPPTVNVTVANGSSHPVPTQAQGTTNVAGTVAATQSGPWSVNVGSMPPVTGSVAVNSLPPVTGSVSVSDDPAAPLAVIGAAPTQTMWAFKELDSDDAGDPNGATAAIFTVPTGKTAVIETVSAGITSNDPNQIPELQVYAFDGTTDTTYGGAWIALQNQGTSTNSAVPISVAMLVGTQNVRLYVPAGVTVYATAQIPSPAGRGLRFGGDIQLTGYYLDAS